MYTVFRGIATPPAVSAREIAFRDAELHQRLAETSARRDKEDRDLAAKSNQTTVDAAQYWLDHARTAVRPAAVAAKGPQPPVLPTRPPEPEEHFCRNLFALVLDFGDQFANTKGDEIGSGDFFGKTYQLRADLPGLTGQRLFLRDRPPPTDDIYGFVSPYRGEVRTAVSLDEARQAVAALTKKIQTCNGGVFSPNYPVNLAGSPPSPSDEMPLAIWEALGGTGAYDSDHFQLILKTLPAFAHLGDDKYDVILTIGP